MLQEKLRAEQEANKYRKDVVKELPKLTDSDDLPVYLTRFRQVIEARGIDSEVGQVYYFFCLLAVFLANGSSLFKLIELLHDRLLDGAGYSASDCAKLFLLPNLWY